MTIDEAAAALGIDLLPWQREVAQRILDGERVMVARGRKSGMWMLRRVLAKATEPPDSSQQDRRQ